MSAECRILDSGSADHVRLGGKKKIGNMGMAVLKEPNSESWKSFNLFLHKFYLKNPRQSTSVYTTHRLVLCSVHFRDKLDVTFPFIWDAF